MGGRKRKEGAASPASSSECKKPQGKKDAIWAPILAGVAIVLALGANAVIDNVRMQRETPRDGDIFLVSYPKSGNFWMRFLVAHAYLYQDETALKTGKEFDFVSIEEVIPDLEYGPNRAEYHAAAPPRVFKSHQPFTPSAIAGECKASVGSMDDYQCACPNCPLKWSRILHLVRDGRDVMCSYFHFQLGLGTLPSGVEDFHSYLVAAREGRIYPGFHWGQHVQSYLNLIGNSNYDLLTVRYEDLHTNPEKTLSQVTEWAHLNATVESTNKAISASSFERLRTKEEKKGLKLFDSEHADRDSHWRLTRKGKSGTWGDCFTTKESKELFHEMAGEQLMALEYVANENW